MYKNLEKKKIKERTYRERKLAQTKSRQDEIRKKIAAAIIVAELNQKS